MPNIENFRKFACHYIYPKGTYRSLSQPPDETIFSGASRVTVPDELIEMVLVQDNCQNKGRDCVPLSHGHVIGSHTKELSQIYWCLALLSFSGKLAT